MHYRGHVGLTLTRALPNRLRLPRTLMVPLARKGVSLYKISALMGNSPDICRKHYAALMPQEMRDEVEF